MNAPRFVSWADYEGMEGGLAFGGLGSGAEISEINKALSAGASINPPGSVVAGDAFALRVESLERTLRSVTFGMRHIMLWKALSKLPAFNTVEEHNIIHEYGQQDISGFIAEGGLPEEVDPTYERAFAIVKFMGITRKVTHVLTLIRPAHGNVIAQETVNGTKHLLRQVERALFYGDLALDPVQFDGYFKMHRTLSSATNQIDKRGQSLTEDDLMDSAMIIQDAPNYGTPTHMYLNPKVKSDLAKTFFPKAKYDLPNPQNGMVGLDIRGFESPAGDVLFVPDVFIDDGGAPLTGAVGDPTKIPGTPTISTGATTPVNAASQFAPEDAGSYFYRIVAANRFGKSAPVNVGGGAIAVAAGDDTRWGVTPGVGGAVGWYEIFRSKLNQPATTARLILRLPNTAGAGEYTVIDTNTKIAGTTDAIIFQQDVENMAWKQLAPMIKIPLATQDTSIRWMQLIYGVPVLYTPNKNLSFSNIGRQAGSLGA